MSKPRIRFQTCDELGTPELIFVFDNEWLSKNRQEILSWCELNSCSLYDSLVYVKSEELRTAFYLKFTGDE